MLVEMISGGAIMFNQILLWFLLIAPWFLLIPLKKNKVKRFFPAGLFGSLLLTLIFQIADRFKWWEIKENIILLTNNTTSVYGIFLVGTIIILYFTYVRFWIYIITNLIIDCILVFGISTWYEHLGIYKLININSFGVLLLTCLVSLAIYTFQKWLEPVLVNTEQ